MQLLITHLCLKNPYHEGKVFSTSAKTALALDIIVILGLVSISIASGLGYLPIGNLNSITGATIFACVAGAFVLTDLPIIIIQSACARAHAHRTIPPRTPDSPRNPNAELLWRSYAEIEKERAKAFAEEVLQDPANLRTIIPFSEPGAQRLFLETLSNAHAVALDHYVGLILKQNLSSIGTHLPLLTYIYEIRPKLFMQILFESPGTPATLSKMNSLYNDSKTFINDVTAHLFHVNDRQQHFKAWFRFNSDKNFLWFKLVMCAFPKDIAELVCTMDLAPKSINRFIDCFENWDEENKKVYISSAIDFIKKSPDPEAIVSNLFKCVSQSNFGISNIIAAFPEQIAHLAINLPDASLLSAPKRIYLCMTNEEKELCRTAFVQQLEYHENPQRIIESCLVEINKLARSGTPDELDLAQILLQVPDLLIKTRVSFSSYMPVYNLMSPEEKIKFFVAFLKDRIDAAEQNIVSGASYIENDLLHVVRFLIENPKIARDNLVIALRYFRLFLSMECEDIPLYHSLMDQYPDYIPHFRVIIGGHEISQGSLDLCKIPLVRLIASSSFFRNLLSNENFKEFQTKTICLSGLTSDPEIAEEFYRYLLTGQLNESASPFTLAIIAALYDIPDLMFKACKLIIENFEDLEKDNPFQIAEDYDLYDLTMMLIDAGKVHTRVEDLTKHRFTMRCSLGQKVSKESSHLRSIGKLLVMQGVVEKEDPLPEVLKQYFEHGPIERQVVLPATSDHGPIFYETFKHFHSRLQPTLWKSTAISELLSVCTMAYRDGQTSLSDTLLRSVAANLSEDSPELSLVRLTFGECLIFFAKSHEYKLIRLKLKLYEAIKTRFVPSETSTLMIAATGDKLNVLNGLALQLCTKPSRGKYVPQASSTSSQSVEPLAILIQECWRLGIKTVLDPQDDTVKISIETTDCALIDTQFYEVLGSINSKITIKEIQVIDKRVYDTMRDSCPVQFKTLLTAWVVA